MSTLNAFLIPMLYGVVIAGAAALTLALILLFTPPRRTRRSTGELERLFPAPHEPPPRDLTPAPPTTHETPPEASQRRTARRKDHE